MPPLDNMTAAQAGPLADHIANHAELSALAMSERDQMLGLIAVADGVAVTEVPLLEEDVHDLDGLARLARLLIS